MESRRLQWLRVITTKDNLVYVTTYTALENTFEDFESDAEQMISSFEFEQARQGKNLKLKVAISAELVELAPCLWV